MVVVVNYPPLGQDLMANIQCLNARDDLKPAVREVARKNATEEYSCSICRFERAISRRAPAGLLQETEPLVRLRVVAVIYRTSKPTDL